MLRPINVMLRHRRLTFGLPVLGLLAFTVLGLLRQRTYTATASFMPQTSQMPASQFSGVAAQFGLALPGGESGQSPAFYAELVKSREILRQVADTRYRFPAGPDTVSGTLIELYGIKGRTEEWRRDAALRRARRMIAARPDPKTGVVSVTVTARWPALAEDMARRVLTLVNQFNLERRQSQASAERRFVEARRKELEDELRQAEGKLQAFLQQNREFRNSPQLTFQHDRLSRDVLMRQQVYTSLAQAYEKARIDEVRNTPVITVVEQPDRPVRPDARGALMAGVVGFLICTLLGIVAAFGREFLVQSREQDPEAFRQFVALRTTIRDELSRPWRSLRARQ